MLNASNTASGQSVGTPDVCNTPSGTVDVPTPYTNTAMHTQAINAAKTVFVGMASALNQGSLVASSNGDEAGTSHSTTRGAQTFSAGNSIVFVGGLPGITVSSLTSHNNANCPVGSVAQAGSSTVFYTLRPPLRADDSPRGTPAAGEALPLDLERLAVLELAEPSVRSVARLSAREGLVVLGVLGRAAASELEAALVGPLAGIRELKLDLSDSPGGSLQEALRVAGMFVPRGTLLGLLSLAATESDDDDALPLVDGRDEPWDLELELRVGPRTASAAEVLAGALQAVGRARCVGDRTYGKGSVQRVVVLRGGPHQATVGEVLLPDGARIQGVGVAPG